MGEKVEELKGRAKEAVGAVTGQDDLREEGKAQQKKVEAEEQAQEKVAEAQEAKAEAQAAEAEQRRQQ